MFSSNNSQVSNDAVFVEDIFSTYLYTGNGTSQTITNGIDLAGKGGMVWIKDRAISSAQGLFDTVSGATKYVQAQSSTSQNTDSTTLTSFNSNGFSLGSNGNFNSSASSIAAWTFRQQAKFFTVVSWTGNGANRAINHDLGSVPGCILIKCKSNVGTNWAVYHRSIANTEYLTLNTTDAKATNTTYWNSTTPTNTQFSLGTSSLVNANGFTYVAYLFAHDAGGFGLTGTDNVISCGSYTGTGANGNNVTLGYEPQWLLIKRTNSIDPWLLFDNMRGMSYSDNKILYPNYSQAEDSAGGWVSPTATGFVLNNTQSSSNGSGSTYIYIAIRRGPMKVPTSGTSVFLPATTSNDSTSTNFGFPIDLFWENNLGGSTYNTITAARLTGNSSSLVTSNTNAAITFLGSLFGGGSQNSYTAGVWGGGNPVVQYGFRRAPSFMDVVCIDSGNYSTPHNLGVPPELIISKRRTSGGSPEWWVTVPSLGYAYLSTTDAFFGAPVYGAFTATNFTPPVIGSYPSVNWLFATCPGVSKVGFYIGDGTTGRVINCGFASGARFILLKKSSTTSSWYVYDTARGIVSGNEKSISLNTTAAESGSADVIDPDASGFAVGTGASDFFNELGVSYTFLAIA